MQWTYTYIHVFASEAVIGSGVISSLFLLVRYHITYGWRVRTLTRNFSIGLFRRSRCFFALICFLGLA